VGLWALMVTNFAADRHPGTSTKSSQIAFAVTTFGTGARLLGIPAHLDGDRGYQYSRAGHKKMKRLIYLLQLKLW